MVDAVTADDCLTSWRAALMRWLPSLPAVSRHLFIPGTVWVDNDADAPPALVPLHREQDPDRWLELAYATDYVVTGGRRSRKDRGSAARYRPARHRVRSSSR